MGSLINCHRIAKAFGPKPLFQEISLTIADNDKLGIIGPNGSGKSTLLKILAGIEEPDDGTLSITKGVRLIYVHQQSSYDGDKTVSEILTEVLDRTHVSENEKQARLSVMLGKVGFADPDQLARNLSGGWKKRLSIACALIQEPDILMLDEPTNHLDLEGIMWLEDFLMESNSAYVVISHDRYFLERVTNRTVEINPIFPGGMFSSQGAYSEFLVKKADFISGQRAQQATLANRVRREVEWLARGPQARSTKQQARINSAHGLIDDLSSLNQRLRRQDIGIDLQATQRKTKKLIELVNVTKKLGERTLFNKLNLTLSPGIRLGLLGANASGKSTLLKMMANLLDPDSGRVDRADDLKFVYFEQQRDTLDPAKSLRRTLAPDGDSVVYRGGSVHVASWASRFLFQASQLDTQIGKLSGGELARVHIAKLMLNPADVLLLDEPTNDLDIPTLEILEESLSEFPGAVVLVTHDRFMLDRVSTQLLALDGAGGAQFYADVAQWETEQKALDRARMQLVNKSRKKSDSSREGMLDTRGGKKLGYMDQRELDQMEGKIADAEARLSALQEQMDDPNHAASSEKSQELYAAYAQAQTDMEVLYTRWAELEAKKR